MYEKWLQAFHLVATERGFTAAANVLNIGQPTVSTHIKSLEDHFGVELIYRRGRRIELAPLGEALFTITRGLYSHEAEAVRLLQSARALEAGRIDLAAIGPFDIIELLETFRASYPKIESTVFVADVDVVVDSVRSFRTDVAIVGTEIDDPTFQSKFYNRHEVLVIVNASHRLARRKSIHLKELNGEDMVLRAPTSTTRRAFEAAAKSANIQVRPVIEINSREAAREAVVRGIGFGVVSETEFAPDPRLRAIKIFDARIYTYAYLLCLRERADRPIIKAFLDSAEHAIKARSA